MRTKVTESSNWRVLNRPVMCLKSFAGAKVNRATLMKKLLSRGCFYQSSRVKCTHFENREVLSWRALLSPKRYALRELSQFQNCLKNYVCLLGTFRQGVGAVPCVFRMVGFSCHLVPKRNKDLCIEMACWWSA